MVAKPAPNEDANEQNPRNLRVLDEEPRDVPCFFDPILVASVRHILFLIYLRNDFDGFSIVPYPAQPSRFAVMGAQEHSGKWTASLRELHLGETHEVSIAGTGGAPERK